jgi:ADP-ribose pyrophosphatase
MKSMIFTGKNGGPLREIVGLNFNANFVEVDSVCVKQQSSFTICDEELVGLSLMDQLNEIYQKWEKFGPYGDVLSLSEIQINDSKKHYVVNFIGRISAESLTEATPLVQEEVLFRGKVFDVIRITQILSDGKKRVTEKIKMRNAAAIIPILRNGRIVLIRQYRPAIGKFIYEIPAGKLEEGETSTKAVERELVEETGYSVTRDTTCMTSISPTPGCVDETIDISFAQVGEKQEQSLDDDEKIEVFDFTLDEVLAMIDNHEIIDAKTIIGILMLDRIRKSNLP